MRAYITYRFTFLPSRGMSLIDWHDAVRDLHQGYEVIIACIDRVKVGCHYKRERRCRCEVVVTYTTTLRLGARKIQAPESAVADEVHVSGSTRNVGTQGHKKRIKHTPVAGGRD